MKNAKESKQDSSGLVFNKSTSDAQAYVAAPKFDRPGVKASDLFKYPQEWLRYRLTGEQLAMTVLILLNIYSTSELAISGKKANDSSRLYGGIAATAFNIWGFFSSRSAVEPEGKNFFERTKNIFRNPDQSAVQFGWVMSFFINVILTGGNFNYGIRNFGHETPDIHKIAKSRLYQASFGTTVDILRLSSLFTAPKPATKPPVSIQNNSAVIFKISQSQSLSFFNRARKVALYAYERDKGGLLSRSLSLASNIAKIYESFKTIGLERQGIAGSGGGKSLLRSSLVSFGLVLSQAYFNYSRMYEDAREERTR